MMKPGRAVHPTNGIGTAPDAASTPSGVEISFDVGGVNRTRASTAQVIISNLAAAGGNNLEVSFASGKEWFSIPPAKVVSFEVSCHKCFLRGKSGGTTSYAILGIII